MTHSPGEVTVLLQELTAGDREAADKLFLLVSTELRHRARQLLNREYRRDSLPPTGLMDEAFFRLLRKPPEQWHDRGHFFALATRVMRQILVERARQENTRKRGGEFVKVPLEDHHEPATLDADLQWVEIDELLTALAAENARKAQVAELRIFGGLSIDEIVAVIGVSRATVKTDWTFVKAWLRKQLEGRP